MLPTTNGPEGVLPITERGLLAISSETDDAAAGVRSAISLFRLDRVAESAAWPSIRSTTTAGVPIGWSALGALSAKPGSSSTLYAAADTVISNATLYTVDTRQSPARITSAIPVTRAGQPAKLDVEGLFARPSGGFWLAVEGATGARQPAGPHRCVRSDPEGGRTAGRRHGQDRQVGPRGRHRHHRRRRRARLRRRAAPAVGDHRHHPAAGRGRDRPDRPLRRGHRHLATGSATSSSTPPRPATGSGSPRSPRSTTTPSPSSSATSSTGPPPRVKRIYTVTVPASTVR